MSDILAASLQIATALISSLSASEKEHEETLTGTLFGSLLASNTLLALLTAHLDLPVSQCWWGSYSKSLSNNIKDTEAGSGADFALLTFPQEGGARLAIFQAKRGERRKRGKHKGRWFFDVNRVPQPPRKKGASAREPQMVVLVETARELSELAGPQKNRPLPVVQPTPDTTAQAIVDADLADFDWVHYLTYSAAGVECIALRYLSSAYLKELSRRRTKTLVSLQNNCVKFTNVVEHGTGSDSLHWLHFEDAQAAISSLPNLVSLVPVIVGDASGAHQHDLTSALGINRLVPSLQGGPLADLVEKVRLGPSSPSSTPRPS